MLLKFYILSQKTKKKYFLISAHFDYADKNLVDLLAKRGYHIRKAPFQILIEYPIILFYFSSDWCTSQWNWGRFIEFLQGGKCRKRTIFVGQRVKIVPNLLGKWINPTAEDGLLTQLLLFSFRDIYNFCFFLKWLVLNNEVTKKPRM